jgi:hypothetical protein
MKYGFGAIGLYILVAYSGGTSLVGTGFTGASGLVKAFQGR